MNLKSSIFRLLDFPKSATFLLLPALLLASPFNFSTSTFQSPPGFSTSTFQSPPGF